MKKDKKQQIQKMLKEVNKLIKNIPDRQIPDILGDGILSDFLQSIVKPKPKSKAKKQNMYDYLLKNKNRLAILAFIRFAIQINYSIKGKVNNGIDVFVSPFHLQWFKDGVVFTQGKEGFKGLIGLYQNKKIKFAVAARDFKKGEDIGPNDFLFIDVEKVKKKLISKTKNINNLDNALKYLKSLLDNKENNEEKYQEFFTKYPWIFGAQYEKVDSHKKLNDENIPDFTGVRIKDKYWDIIEIKQPFLKLFKKGNYFNSSFNDSWNQTEGYLDFVVQNSDYLYREKGMLFDNPQCFLLVGYNLSEKQIKILRTKERRNPSIKILTYNDVLAMGKATRDFFNNLKTEKEITKK